MEWLFEDMARTLFFGNWHGVKDGHPAALDLYLRHYSARRYRDGRERKLFVGPGEKLVLLTPCNDALFVWRKFIDKSGQQGVNCAVFRNEGNVMSSLLIEEAVAIAQMRWPGERFYTYVSPRRIRSTNPGYCFQILLPEGRLEKMRDNERRPNNF